MVVTRLSSATYGRGLDNLHKFDRDAKACPSPRSWDKVSTLLGFDLPEGAFQHALFGTVGDGVGADFLAYRKLTTKGSRYIGHHCRPSGN